MASGGLAGGLADGMANGMQFYMQNKYYSGLNDNREELNRIRSDAAATKAEGTEKKGSDREGFVGSLMPIFKASNTPQRPTITSQAGLGPATLPDTSLLGGNSAGAYQAPGLASVAPAKNQAQPAQPEEDFNPIHEIVKQVGFGNLANDPGKLNAIRAAAAMHGMGKEIDPWLDSLVASKKSGIFDAAMDLKRGNIDGALDNLKRGGIQLEDRPSRIDPNDNSKWKVNISGSGEQTINLDDWATSTLDPEKYSKFLLDRQDSATKGRVADSQVKENESRTKVNNAQIGKLGEETRTLKADRLKADTDGIGGLSKLPAPAATAEWLVRKGVYKNHADAFNAVKTLNDKSPSAARADLIEAAMKNGSTIAEAAKEVDAFLVQQGGVRAGAPAAPGGNVRKFNPQTGQFD